MNEKLQQERRTVRQIGNGRSEPIETIVTPSLLFLRWNVRVSLTSHDHQSDGITYHFSPWFEWDKDGMDWSSIIIIQTLCLLSIWSSNVWAWKEVIGRWTRNELEWEGITPLPPPLPLSSSLYSIQTIAYMVDSFLPIHTIEMENHKRKERERTWPYNLQTLFVCEERGRRYQNGNGMVILPMGIQSKDHQMGRQVIMKRTQFIWRIKFWDRQSKCCRLSLIDDIVIRTFFFD